MNLRSESIPLSLFEKNHNFSTVCHVALHEFPKAHQGSRLKDREKTTGFFIFLLLTFVEVPSPLNKRFSVFFCARSFFARFKHHFMGFGPGGGPGNITRNMAPNFHVCPGNDGNKRSSLYFHLRGHVKIMNQFNLKNKPWDTSAFEGLPQLKSKSIT